MVTVYHTLCMIQFKCYGLFMALDVFYLGDCVMHTVVGWHVLQMSVRSSPLLLCAPVQVHCWIQWERQGGVCLFHIIGN
jgi:hypothetical protein